MSKEKFLANFKRWLESASCTRQNSTKKGTERTKGELPKAPLFCFAYFAVSPSPSTIPHDNAANF